MSLNVMLCIAFGKGFELERSRLRYGRVKGDLKFGAVFDIQDVVVGLVVSHRVNASSAHIVE
jgi:hypothetical protein